MKAKYQILVVGGGNAGISVSAKILIKKPDAEIAIIDPSEFHYYQPAWTLVGAGTFDMKKTIRRESEVIPKGVTWIKERVDRFEPEENRVITAEGNTYSYEQLIVCPGIQLDWDKVQGLRESLGTNGVTSNYHPDYAEYTWKCLKEVPANGTALFTNPNTPIKCGGAPQKIMYLAGDYFRKKGWTGKTEIGFYSGGKVIFGIKKYADSLLKMVKKYGIKLNFQYNLVAIDGPKRIATFEHVQEDGSVTLIEKKFDMIHVTPPQSAPDFVKRSPLANEQGWVDVDKHSLRHNKYPNVWALGDAGSTPNAKTGAAIRKQSPVLAENITKVLNNQAISAQYNGYGSCPLVVGYGKLILAEFDYDNVPTETFPFDQSKPRWSMWMLKKFVLPWMYWNKILKGTA
ncbi:MAG: NAD(P)/FAD-dependent oxidoreductase [Flavobacteriales bacterium]|nr:NAD(P)/FAD-dependent oxidoreductase [Flavobacteriales bacterium]